MTALMWRIWQKGKEFSFLRNILSANMAAVVLFSCAKVDAICMAVRGNGQNIPPLSIYLTPAQSVTGHYFQLSSMFCLKQDHLASCPHEIVSCTNKNCNLKMEREGLEDHVTTKCDWRILQCKFCAVSRPMLKMEVHIFPCSWFLY